MFNPLVDLQISCNAAGLLGHSYILKKVALVAMGPDKAHLESTFIIHGWKTHTNGRTDPPLIHYTQSSKNRCSK